MFKVDAVHYIAAGAVFRDIERELDLRPSLQGKQPNDLLDERAMHFVWDNLKALSQHCWSMRLQTTHLLIGDFAKDHAQVKKRLPTFAEAMAEMKTIKKAFEAEMKSQLFFFIPARRNAFYTCDHTRYDENGNASTEPLFGDQIGKLFSALPAFEDAVYDAKEAGNCFVCERYTATVYHLMRVAEYGLVAVGVAAGVQTPEHRSWDKLIAGLHGHIKRLSSSKPVTNWKDEEKKFSDLVAWFTAIRNGWRNPVSHIPRVYNEQTAEGMFAVTITLFTHLNQYGIKQVPMAREPITLPDEADA